MTKDAYAMFSEGQEEEIASPCIRNCCLDDNDICLGCHRTITEIMNWSSSTQAQKKNILMCCQRRADDLGNLYSK